MSDGSKMDWKTLVFGLLAMVFTAQIFYSMTIGFEKVYLIGASSVLTLFSSYMIILKGNPKMYKVAGAVAFSTFILFYKDSFPILSEETDTTFQTFYLAISILSISICFVKILPHSK